ncbi:MAG: nucleotidyl transferase AbiEii/AbiGii toxin family protein [Eubacteriales bacterium]|nr:nucleotidyl transferase AbiEii/AbiGii toxin family protein [Eubacteriales bacterium]MDD4716677.1 nucleotidyl transferase AbiEii/AbiGii toxin family protein [Eubacteriales bacterium]
MADIGASILAKLKNKAKASGMPYQQCLQLFFQEEFLRRLSKSGYAENFILKGGLFIYTLTNFESRATIDIDFLMRQMSNDLDHMDAVIEEIIATPTGNNDVVILSAKNTERISPQRRYPGVSTQIIGRIKNVRLPFDVDVGIGDVIIPKPQRRAMTPQLEGYDAPEVLTYSLESTIAEKFDAILQRFELTGRMKDFYDIYYLAQSFEFDGRSLQEAIAQTLSTRGTPYERDSFDRLVALADDTDMQVKWRYFLRTIKGREIAFSDVIAALDRFLRPVWEAIVNEGELLGTWSSGGDWEGI